MIERQIIENLRREYSSEPLNQNDVDDNPLRQFSKWFQEALNAEVHEPNAMTLATAGPDRRPTARIVLLKGIDDKGFSFYTNYLSAKGKEIAKNPAVALVFFWPELARQVRIEGTVEKLSKEESEKYFNTRPRGSQIGAHVSAQSQVILNRDDLEAQWAEMENKYEGKSILKPSYWGGYLVKPQLIEFWQGRASRLHDRIVYKRADKSKWKIQRLAP